MSTPAYAPPSVGPAGLSVSTYQSILADNIQAFLNIYGQNQYVGPDSAIYQLLSIISLKQSDTNQGLQLAYNQSSPQTAVGAGLDRVTKMNGLARDSYTYSTAIITLTGVPGTPINNGSVQDQAGNLWALPATVSIVGGSINVQATCTTPGNVAAEPNTINIIATPVSGWDTATNPSAAISGNPVESDSQYRARQAISVALPALTPIAATIAAVLAVDGVTRIAPGYPTPGGPGTSIENPTAVTDSWGNPAHSISMVVEGGSDQDVADAIDYKKTIGCFTNGTTSIPVPDPVTGFITTISFYRPTYLTLFVAVVIAGYGSAPTSATLSAIQSAVASYLNNLSIGEVVSVAAVSYEVMNVNSNLSAPTFGVQSILIGLANANTTSPTTSGSSALTVASAAGIVVGQYVYGAGIPLGTTVSAISGTSVTMSQNATATATSVPLAFAALSDADVPMPNYFYVAQSAASDVFVGIS